MFRSILLSMAGLLLTCSTFANSFSVVEHVPDSTVFIGKIDVEAVRNSTIAQDLMDLHSQQLAMARTFMREFVGLDPESVHTAWVLGEGDQRGLVILKGSFSDHDIRNKFGNLPNVERVTRHGTLYAVTFEDDKKPDTINLGAVIDKDTLLVGNQEYADTFLRSARLDRGLLPVDDPRLVQVDTSTHSITGIVLKELSDLPNMDKDFASAVEQAMLIVNVKDGVQVEIQLTASDQDHASALASIGKGLLEIKRNGLQAAAGGPARLQDLPRRRIGKQIDKAAIAMAAISSAKVTQNGQMVTLSIEVPGQDIRNALAKK